MPMFPGERPMTPREIMGDEFRHNAMPGYEAQTGVTVEMTQFNIVPVNVGQPTGIYNYIVARPLDRNFHAPSPDVWWVWDADRDESEGWVPQATFTPDGLLDYGDDNPEGGGGGPGEPDPDDGEDPGGMFPAWEGAVRTTEPCEPPRDPNAPVTMSIDLEEHEVAAREGLTAWEEHGDFAVLATEKGIAVVHGGEGIVRYPDKTACTVHCSNGRQAREQAEKFLANRPYQTAYERVLGEPEIGTETEPAPPPEPEVAATAPPQRPVPTKRVWNTVPITSAEDDD